MITGGELMASVEKIIQKMKNQPNGIKMTEANKVLEAYGYRLDRQKGSHRQYINKEGNVITIKDDTEGVCQRHFKQNRGVKSLILILYACR